MKFYQQQNKAEYKERFISLISMIDKSENTEDCLTEIQKYAPQYQTFDAVLADLRQFIYFISEEKLNEIRHHYPSVMEVIENDPR